MRSSYRSRCQTNSPFSKVILRIWTIFNSSPCKALLKKSNFSTLPIEWLLCTTDSNVSLNFNHWFSLPLKTELGIDGNLGLAYYRIPIILIPILFFYNFFIHFFFNLHKNILLVSFKKWIYKCGSVIIMIYIYSSFDNVFPNSLSTRNSNLKIMSSCILSDLSLAKPSTKCACV